MNKYEEIEQYIKTKIENNEIVVGDQIPTEIELAEQFHTSRPTVRQALQLLREEGYLARFKGKGSFVTKPKVLHESTSFIASYRKECEKKNQKLITKVLAQEVMKVDQEIMEYLDLAKGSKVICLKRFRLIENLDREIPVVYTIVYVPYKSHEFLLEADFTQQSFYDVMEEHGKKVTHASRSLEVRMPEQEISSILQMGSFEPTIYVQSVGKTILEEKVEYSISYYPASSSQFLIEVNR